LYLEWLAQTGVIGTALFLIVIGLWMRKFHQQRAVILASPVATGLFISLMIWLLPLTSGGSFHITNTFGIMFWWIGGWLFAYLKRVK